MIYGILIISTGGQGTPIIMMSYSYMLPSSYVYTHKDKKEKEKLFIHLYRHLIVLWYRTNYSDVSTTLEEEELPYRLIASDMDSNHFETSNIERDSSTQSRATEKERVLQLLNPMIIYAVTIFSNLICIE